MGFLDNSTNNIIVDAVLTDYGRELLARNDGSFSIVKFAMGDDEVDYTIIRKFGRTVGKEKIEKNTPIFEAQTNQNLGLKYKLVSLSNPTITKMPGVSISGDVSTAGLGSAAASMEMKAAGPGAIKCVKVVQEIADENTMDVEMRDQSYIIKAPGTLIDLIGAGTPESIDADGIYTYIMTRDPITSPTGGTSVSLDFQTRSLSQSLFDVLGDANNKAQISTSVEIIGMQSGTSTTIDISILQ